MIYKNFMYGDFFLPLYNINEILIGFLLEIGRVGVACTLPSVSTEGTQMRFHPSTLHILASL